MASQTAKLKWVRKMPALINVDGFRFTRRIPVATSTEARACRARLVRKRAGREVGGPTLGLPGPFFWLTHFHGDHTTGLSSTFGGTVHATPVTAALLVGKLGLPESRVQVVPISRPGAIRPFKLCDGIEVIVLDANHCPGAGMPVFRCRELSTCVLHCGDMRAGEDAVREWCAVLREWGVTVRGPSGSEVDDGVLLSSTQRVSLVYLDSTYLVPAVGGRASKWDFPSQTDVLAALRELARRESEGDDAGAERSGDAAGTGTAGASRHELPPRAPANGAAAPLALLSSSPARGAAAAGVAPPPAGRALFVVGTYQIGKERAAEALAEACGSRVVVLDEAKARIVRMTGLASTGLYCREVSARDRVVLAPLFEVRTDLLETWLRRRSVRAAGFTRVVGLKLTGWTLRGMGSKGALLSAAARLERAARTPQRSRSGLASVYSLPYSEHSSGPEVRAFAAAVAPEDVVFTVNADTADKRQRLREMLRPSLPWLAAGRHTVEAAMHRLSALPAAKPETAAAAGGSAAERGPAESGGHEEADVEPLPPVTRGADSGAAPASGPRTAGASPATERCGAVAASAGADDGELIDLVSSDEDEPAPAVNATAAGGKRERAAPSAPRRQASLTDMFAPKRTKRA